MANGMYNKGKVEILASTINILQDDIKLLLIESGSGYTYDPDNNYVSDISGYEASGTGYSRVLITSMSVSQDDVNNYAVLDGNDVTFSSVDIGTVSAAVAFKDSGSVDASSSLLFYIDNQFPVIGSGGDIVIEWNASGILAF